MKKLLFIICLVLFLSAGIASADNSLVADYRFSEGSGSVLKDFSGNGNNGKIVGAEWVKLGKSYALKFNGADNWVDCGDTPSLDLTKVVTFEIWLRADAKPSGEVGIMGKFYESIMLSYYKDGGAWWYVSGGDNAAHAPIESEKWQHLVSTFDGKAQKIYVNGLLFADKPTVHPTINRGGNFYIGRIPAIPDSSNSFYAAIRPFLGLIGSVRVYNRALSKDEVETHYKNEAENFGIDKTWFNRVHMTPYAYYNDEKIVVIVDYKGLLPIAGSASVQLQLAKPGDKTVIRSLELNGLMPWGEKEAVIDVKGLKAGTYEVRAVYKDERGVRPEERVSLKYTESKTKLVSPDSKVAPPLPAALKPIAYKFDLCAGGGFKLNIGGKNYPVESTFSYPQAGENKLIAGANASGEKTWKVSVKKIDASNYEVSAQGTFYTIKRSIRLYPNRISVSDIITNISSQDVGIMLSNNLNYPKSEFADSYLSGYKTFGSKIETLSPSVFIGKKGLGFGIVPLDDVYIVQSRVFNLNGIAGIASDKFALASNASYTLNWAIYPNKTGDYYDFINQVRVDEGRNHVTVEGQWANQPGGPFEKSIDLPEENFFKMRSIKYYNCGSFSQTVDDPGLSAEGIEFMNFPKTIQLNKERAALVAKKYPNLICLFHVAHSLYATNKPKEIFSDSRVIDKDGNQPIWGAAPPWMSQERIDEGWGWYIYYSTPGNSFHNELMKSVDVAMDAGYKGIFMDGFMMGYMALYTYDKWDGHTADIDPNTKEIKRKVGSVLLLSQPSLVEFVDKVNSKGGVVVANNSVITRTIGKQKIVHDRECVSGPDVHLAPDVVALSDAGRIHGDNEIDVYREALDRLKWGNLMFFYGECRQLTHQSLCQQMFPITFEEIHSGYVKGRERLITMNPGVYGWAGNSDMHFSYKFDSRGAPANNDFLTTIDSKGVRTAVMLKDQESAVIKKIPVAVNTSSKKGINALCSQYDEKKIEFLLSGNGKVNVTARSGDFAILPNTEYILTINGNAKRITSDTNGTLLFQFILNGEYSISVSQ